MSCSTTSPSSSGSRGHVRPVLRVRAEDVLFAVYDATLAFKATLPRLVPAGDIGDTDVYGAQQHARSSMSTFRF